MPALDIVSVTTLSSLLNVIRWAHGMFMAQPGQYASGRGPNSSSRAEIGPLPNPDNTPFGLRRGGGSG